MPWNYPDNIPPAMKHFKSNLQMKAISIANHVLANTGDEGLAIATGIKKAKQLTKIAESLPKLKDNHGTLIKLAANSVMYKNNGWRKF